MSYQTYITEALVCGSFDSKGADRSYLLFTREAGMLYAHAKSVREERSKHRYALQVCSHIRATLVRGKTGWKITGAEPIQDLYANADSREARAFLRNTILLLRRVIHGETTHEEIFDDIITTCSEGVKYAPAKLEHVLSLRILHALGYIAPNGAYNKFLHCSMPYHHVTALTEEEGKACEVAITKALLESQL